MTSRILVAIRVNAAPDRAFDVFSAQIGAWWQPNDVFAFTKGSPGRLAFEPGVGGRLTETRADGSVFEIGRITDWSPGFRLAFTWRQASFTGGQETRVEVSFEPVGDQTRVTVQHFGWDTVPQDNAARHGFPDSIFLQRHGEWWQVQLQALGAALSMRG